MPETIDLLSSTTEACRRLLGAGAPEVLRSEDRFPKPGYRTWLAYWWGDGDPLIAIGQNASVADRRRGDHTVTMCARRAWRAGRAGLVMLNLFPLVATYPEDLWAAEPDEAIEQENRDAREEALRRWPGASILFAPGDSADPRHHARASSVEAGLRSQGREILCLGLTAGGAPRHPSRAGYAHAMVPWAGPWKGKGASAGGKAARARASPGTRAGGAGS